MEGDTSDTAEPEVQTRNTYHVPGKLSTAVTPWPGNFHPLLHRSFAEITEMSSQRGKTKKQP